MCTYEDLVAATLPHGLTPLVVPQLRTITLGGAVTGLGIESASFRNGLPHESVLEMDVLTGAGEVVTRRRQRGSRPVPRLPQLVRHPGLRHPAAHRARAGGRRRGAAPRPLPRRRRRSSTRSARSSPSRCATTANRWTTSTGWCSPATSPTSCSGGGPTSPARPATTPARRSTTARSSTTTRTRDATCSDPRLPVALGHRLVLVLAGVRRPAPAWSAGSGRGAGGAAASTGGSSRWTAGSVSPTGSRPGTAGRRVSGSCRTSRCRSTSTADFLRWFLREVPIEPVWLCPLRLRSAEATARGRCTRCGRARPTSTSASGRWCRSDPRPVRRRRTGASSARSTAQGGHKSLYSEPSTTQDEFDRLYGGAAYAVLKER